MRKILFVLAALAIPAAAHAESEVSVVLQGGGVQYNRDLAGQTDLGAAYGARVNVMPTPYVGFEVAYLGTQNNVRQSLDARGTNERLVTNGALADLRINVLPGDITPYVFGGFGVTKFSISNQAFQSPFRSDAIAEVPFGTGIEANLGAFKLGARFQYNYLLSSFYNPVSATTGPAVNGRSSDFYGATIDLGASFR